MLKLKMSVEHSKEYSVRIMPILCALPAKQPVDISLLSSSGEYGSLQAVSLPLGPSGLLETIQFKDYSVVTESDYVWEAKDASGEYTVFQSEVDKKLKDTHRRAGSRLLPNNGTFSHDGKQYLIDFISLQMIEDKSQVYLLHKGPPFWCYRDPETGFIRHEKQDSASIEEVYRYGGRCATMGGTKYTFMFSESHSYQVDENTSEMVEITRYPPVKPNHSEIKVKISIRGTLESVLAVESDLDQLHSNSALHKFSFPFLVDEKTQRIVFHQLANITRRYCVSAHHSLDNAQVTTKLWGVQEVVKAVADNILRPLLEAEQQKYVASLSAEPRWWEPQTEECKLMSVRKGCYEWRDVLHRMKQTLPSVEMVRLERVQNQPLWEKFVVERRQMYRRNNGEINEKYLFHGSRNANPRDIVLSLTGVDFRYSRNDKLMWGTGAYFAVNASYSDKFAHQMPSNIKQMILVQVLTGKSCPYDKTHNKALTKPPPLPATGVSASPSPRLYDTVNGDTNGSIVYVVYNHDKSYPAYVITYKYRDTVIPLS